MTTAGETTTLGVDLAAQPAGTAACLIRWTDRRAVVERLDAGIDDDLLTDLHRRSSATAIDAPFGWPLGFHAALRSWERLGPWPDIARDDLRFRVTDRVVRAQSARAPLSVSSDRIAVCAWRCAGLLTRWQITDRLGSSGVYEVYPASALRAWALPGVGLYKNTRDPGAAATARAELVVALRAECGWLELEPASSWEAVAGNHDLLDALIAALIGRACLHGATVQPPQHHQAAARIEGWIHLPSIRPGSLLVGADG
jgi:predicted nuclease with RNAse H fold